MDLDYEKLGQRVRELREERGWSRRRLADETDVSESALKHMEDGKRPDGVPYAPSAPTLMAVANALDSDGPELLEQYGEPAMAERLRKELAPPPAVQTELYAKLTIDQQQSIQVIVNELIRLVSSSGDRTTVGSPNPGQPNRVCDNTSSLLDSGILTPGYVTVDARRIA